MGHVPHLYLPPPWESPTIDLSDEQAHHLGRVLRIGDGALLSYTDGNGRVGEGELRAGSVVRGTEAEVGRPSDVTVAVPAPSSRHRARFLVEKLAELGVESLLWLRTRHGSGRPPAASKVRAWTVAALEQSRGGWLMRTGDAEWSDLTARSLVVAHPGGGSVPEVDRPVLVVGPEGGLADDEIPAGAARVSLGSTILRVETAALVGAALLASRPRGL